MKITHMIYFHKFKDNFSDAVNSELESERIDRRFTLQVHKYNNVGTYKKSTHNKFINVYLVILKLIISFSGLIA
jgi:hypothetical protein